MSEANIEQWTKLIDDPNYSNEERAKAYYQRGNSYKQQEKYDEAIADYSQAILLYTDDNDKAWAYTYRGISYLRQREYDKSIADLEYAETLYTDIDGELIAGFNLANAYVRLHI